MMSFRHRPVALLLFSVVALTAVTLIAGLLTRDLLQERRALLLGNLEAEMETSVASLAGLVSERARDIRSDLTTAAELVTRQPIDDHAALDTVHAHLIALERSTKHYRKLWFVQQGESLLEVTGLGHTERAIPEIARASLLAVANAASARPGHVATALPTLREPTDYDRLQLFALASAARPHAVFVVLVSLDALFDSLQRRAHLPGIDLWVVDADGNILVDPGSVPPHQRQQIVAALTSENDSGKQIVGSLPSLWPFAAEGGGGQLLVFESSAGPTIRWTTGMTTSLAPAGSELRETAARLVGIGSIVLAAILIALVAWLWLYAQQQRLEERIAYRDQLVHTERLSTLGQMAASVAHEIGTPLGIISLRLDQLLEKQALRAERSKLVAMKEQIDRIGRIMRQMLDYARRRSHERGPIDLQTVIGRAHDLIEHRLRNRGVSFKASVEAGCIVEANNEELHQLFLNLIANACDACDTGDQIQVTAAIQPTAGRVRIEVADSGGGVPEEIRSAIFEPFFSTKKAGEGTGLGLTIVQDIVERHGATIELTSSSQGTSFCLYWPLYVQPQRDGTNDQEIAP